MPSKSAKELEAAIDQALDRCSLATRGLWTTMRYLIENKCDGRPGDLRMNGAPPDAEQIAIMARCTAAKVLRLLESLQSPRVSLLQQLPDGTYHAPHLARLAEARSTNANRQARFRRINTTSKVGDRARALHNAQKGVMSHHSNAVVTPAPPPPSSSPPITPPTTPPDPLPFSSKTAGDAVSEAGASAETEEPKGAKFPPGVWRKATDGWKNAYRHVHGFEYRGNSRHWKALAQILHELQANLEALAQVVRAWLREPEVGRAKGHTLPALADDLNYILGKIAKGTIGHGPAKPTAAERGQFAEEPVKLPISRRATAV